MEPVNDDTIQCLFFSPKLGSDILLWEDLCVQLNNSIKNLAQDYIWHRDEFRVFVPITDNMKRGVPTHLCSNTCFGDNLEDEWFIVHVVLEISKQYNDLIIQVKDNDGNFLLIEAANYLQTWANPENTENRVFIHDHHIHIIPPEVIALHPKLDLDQALKKIIQSPDLTQAAPDIEQAILNRIGNYPDKILENLHRTIVKLPATLATILTIKPTLIAPIVNAYCNYDDFDAKSCKNIDVDDFVTVEVKFTKFLYATLIHSKLITHVKHCIQGERDKKNLVGIKLMCGFQMIMNNNLLNNSFKSREYQTFINSLKQNGYFKDNIEDSTEYNNLLGRAKHYFSTVECPVRSNVFHQISELMKSSEYTRVKDSLKCAPFEPLEYTEDSEDWLNINPEQLNDLLFSRYGTKTKLKNIDDISSQNITEELTSFLKKSSDFEGIERDQIDECDGNEIDFESDQFVSCIEKMLKVLSTNSKEETGSIDSEEDFADMFYDEDDDDFENNDSDYERELKEKLQHNPMENLKDKTTILANIIQSMKEEKASTGPSSNLMRSVGVGKTEFLDSDDD